MSNLTPLAQIIRLQGWGAQRRLARALDMGEPEMSRIVNGRTVPDDATRTAICRELGRTPVDLGWPDPQETPAAA